MTHADALEIIKLLHSIDIGEAVIFGYLALIWITIMIKR